MNYYDMLNRVAFENQMIKRAGGVAEAFGFKPPKPIKLEIPSYKHVTTPEEMERKKLDYQSKKNKEEAAKILAASEASNAEYRKKLEANKTPATPEPKKPDKLDQFFGSIRGIAETGENAGKGIADAGKAVADIMVPVGKETEKAVTGIQEEGKQLAERAQKTYDEYKKEIERLNPTTSDATVVAGGQK